MKVRRQFFVIKCETGNKNLKHFSNQTDPRQFTLTETKYGTLQLQL